MRGSTKEIVTRKLGLRIQKKFFSPLPISQAMAVVGRTEGGREAAKAKAPPPHSFPAFDAKNVSGPKGHHRRCNLRTEPGCVLKGIDGAKSGHPNCVVGFGDRELLFRHPAQIHLREL